MWQSQSCAGWRNVIRGICPWCGTCSYNTWDLPSTGGGRRHPLSQISHREVTCSHINKKAWERNTPLSLRHFLWVHTGLTLPLSLWKSPCFSLLTNSLPSGRIGNSLFLYNYNFTLFVKKFLVQWLLIFLGICRPHCMYRNINSITREKEWNPLQWQTDVRQLMSLPEISQLHTCTWECMIRGEKKMKRWCHTGNTVCSRAQMWTRTGIDKNNWME